MPPDKKPRVLITGATGKLGSFLWARLAAIADVWGTARHPPRRQSGWLAASDIRDMDSVSRLFSSLSPEVCIHCAAIADVDVCEANPLLCRAVNVEGTKNICRAAQQHSARVIFCSTDYVFGNDETEYSEHDETSPLQEYGRSKILGERLVLDTPGSTVLRLPLLYGTSKGCLVAQVRLAVRNRVDLMLDDVSYRYPLFIPDIVPVVRELVTATEFSGVFHLSGPERTTKLSWARTIVAMCTEQGEQPICVTASPPSPRAARRPISIRLDDRRARELLPFEPRSLVNGSRAALQMLNKGEANGAF
jgi:dTDP-4-dehydrorhamnose reductase